MIKSMYDNENKQDPTATIGLWTFLKKGFYRFSIPLKLLILILPLVCIPITIVGYWSVETSVESVTQLSRKLQLLQAKEAARQIDSIFQSAFNDLGIMTRLITYSYSMGNVEGKALLWEKDTFARNVRFLMDSFIKNTPYYFQIRFVNQKAETVVAVSHWDQSNDKSPPADDITICKETPKKRTAVHISPIVKDSEGINYFIHLSKPIFDKKNRFTGAIIFDLDYTRVMELVQRIHVGNRGSAFLVDERGRTIAHPAFEPYEYDLNRYDDPRLREFIIHMLSGKTGWMTFYEQGEKAAAFAPIPSMNWSLAVSIPIDEFKQKANILASNTVMVVMVMILLSTIIVILLSFRIIRPIRNLVMATEQVASGDLSREIPIQSTDELGLLTTSFNRMIISLREIQAELVSSEKLISMGRLSAGVAHEIRNPLNAMKGAITYLKRRRSKDALVMEYSEIVFEEIERLSEFVTEFLLYARQSSPQKITTDLNDLLRTARTLFNNTFQKQKFNVVEQLDITLPMIPLDPQQLEQVFLNLLINAGHAMHGGGTLWISTKITPVERRKKGEPANITVTIRDNGTGIDEDDLKYIFDPFYSTKESGTGLGLPISLSIVENHGGHLRVSSIKGRGTTITIELPVT